jgi:hypothetical protein
MKHSEILEWVKERIHDYESLPEYGATNHEMAIQNKGRVLQLRELEVYLSQNRGERKEGAIIAMSEAACIVCGKVVAPQDQQDHLRSNHLGPHYFWLDGRRFRTVEPSMTGAQIKRLTDAPVMYPMFREDGDWKETPIGDGIAVSLVGEPHFHCVPPATW